MTKKILIIEDEEFLSEMYKLKFKKEGYDVFMADNGDEGIAIAQKENPDLILLDLVLPKMSGYQILEKLKSNNITKNIQVYILSNLSQDEEINKSFKDGADGYFIKANLTPSQLMNNVQQIFLGKKVGLKQKVQKKKEIKFFSAAGQGKVKNKGKNILLFEDDDLISEMYKIKFKSKGYNFIVAKNGAWGTKLAEEKKFDMVIMDIVMPAMNGYQAIKKLRLNKNTKDVPIIVLSNSAQENDIKKAKDCGANSYLLKSKITPEKLIKEVEKFL